jgi:hypothetical protein
VEFVNDPECDLRLGPLNMNAPVETKSMLGADPKLEPEPALDRELEALDSVGRSIGRGSVVVEVVEKNEVSTL